ncbi:MAG: magnesium/cobalt transporter CorA [Gluconacetobacter diazotrophicus]|nr:magnesium/cobalt transporter CorA [Gluconacetobacter diazotrophicus]
MFLAHPLGRQPVAVSEAADIAGIAWLDLINPTDEEHALAQRLCGARLPTRQDIEEIESSSRVYTEGSTLYLSSPLVRRTEENAFDAPVGFVLGGDRLVTLRYTDYSAFGTVGARLAEGEDADAATDAEGVLLLLLEAIVDRIADILELSGRDMDQISHRIFHVDDRGSDNADRLLRRLLRRVGRENDIISSARDSLLGLQRISTFLRENTRRPCSGEALGRLTLLGKDISSLADYDTQLNNKVQFLLDATLGFINIEQNNGIKVLTVVSTVGIPPTLIASIYGMNFKNIPELNWSFGYWYALVLMALTVVVPMLWFWRKGWLGGR